MSGFLKQLAKEQNGEFRKHKMCRIMFTLSGALSVLNSIVNSYILNKNSLYVVDSTTVDYVF